MPVELSINLPTFAPTDPGDWSHLIDFARAADEASVDRLVLADHVVFGQNLDAYGDPAKGGSRGGRQPTDPDGAWLEPIVTIAHLTAVTSRVRFATGILLAALRRPVVLAKMAATVDVLSGGRLDLGVGIGWQREEYEAAGLRFERRGRLLDHTIEVCQALWREQTVSYAGDELSFTNIHQMPKPGQYGGIPIWVSGTVNDRSMDRLARYGAGWIPWGDDRTEVAAGIARMRVAVADRGRDPDTLGVVGALPTIREDNGALDLARTMARVPALVEAGVTDCRLWLTTPGEPRVPKGLLGEVVDAFQTASD